MLHDVQARVVGLVKKTTRMHGVSHVAVRSASRWSSVERVCWQPFRFGESLDSGSEHERKVKESKCGPHELVHFSRRCFVSLMLRIGVKCVGQYYEQFRTNYPDSFREEIRWVNNFMRITQERVPVVSHLWLMWIGPLLHVPLRGQRATCVAARIPDTLCLVTTVALMPRDFDDDAHTSRLPRWKHDFGYVSHRLANLHLVATAELLVYKRVRGLNLYLSTRSNYDVWIEGRCL